MTLDSYRKELLVLFKEHINLEKKEPMEQYMRNLFPFLGIKSPERKALLQDFFKKNGKPELEWIEPLVTFLYGQPEREFHYAALAMIDKQIKKMNPSHLVFLEKLIITNSWWDTVDHLAPHHVGELLLKNRNYIQDFPDRWITEENFWLQRSAILYQLKYKQKTDEEKLFFYINKTKESKEFFIQKAIGWSLREYSKTSPEQVMHFIEGTKLAPLSRREGLKHIERLQMNAGK
ncbi:DNA alkylation repair protein [Sutcliffiella rhizosphaerae]|uniref:DNA alkylation repair protein n=1 Tax=Sutcliffiella rhizosphaerae TaxID=2880967 RepID=UPI001E6469AB|nr:DNA alkylation repair protein [Sutcliffiella rhizosphaerae]